MMAHPSSGRDDRVMGLILVRWVAGGLDPMDGSDHWNSLKKWSKVSCPHEMGWIRIVCPLSVLYARQARN